MFRQPKASSSSLQGSGPAPRKVVIKGQAESCRYPNRVCNQPVLEQYDYCLKHILEDKNAPYKPCGYTYAINNKRCLQPALRGDKRDIGFCSQHVWKTGMKRQKAVAKRVNPVTPESLLASLAHYVRPVGSGSLKSEFDDCPDSPPNTTKAANPFVDIQAGEKRGNVLECGSESDSDVEPATLDTVWGANNEQTSDAESTDSQIDDPLRHAGVYTAEEVILMTRNKMLRLQKLYRRQFERLAHILREKRRKYLHSLKKEKETLSTIFEQSRITAKEQRLYEKLKALNRYQKRSASETLAYLASQEKRARETGGPNYKPQGHSTKCLFTEGGVRCSKVTLPLSKYCFKHILEDQNQCIFRACGCDKADTICKDPVVGLSEGDTCVLHIKLPTLPHLNLLSEDKVKSEEKTITVKSCQSNIGSGVEGNNGGDNESEFDASATESATSTENHGSPMEELPSERIKDLEDHQNHNEENLMEEEEEDCHKDHKEEEEEEVVMEEEELMDIMEDKDRKEHLAET